jgi:hypothetical protein
MHHHSMLDELHVGAKHEIICEEELDSLRDSSISYFL